MIDFLSTSPTICAILIFSMSIMLIGFSSWIESKNGTSKIEVQTMSKEPLKHVSSIDLRKKEVWSKGIELYHFQFLVKYDYNISDLT